MLARLIDRSTGLIHHGHAILQCESRREEQHFTMSSFSAYAMTVREHMLCLLNPQGPWLLASASSGIESRGFLIYRPMNQSMPFVSSLTQQQSRWTNIIRKAVDYHVDSNQAQDPTCGHGYYYTANREYAYGQAQ